MLLPPERANIFKPGSRGDTFISDESSTEMITVPFLIIFKRFSFNSTNYRYRDNDTA